MKNPLVSILDNHLALRKNFSCVFVIKEYGSQLEVAAMSKLYKRDFIIFQNQDQPGIDVTQNDYPRKVISKMNQIF